MAPHRGDSASTDAARFANIVPMSRMVRFLAALMLVFMVPVQAGAAACAQLCATAAFEHRLADAVAGGDHESAGEQESPAEDLMHGHHCDKSDPVGKCCHGHTAMAQQAAVAAPVVVPPFERAWFVARWTNFIPEEPSPPPIRSSRTA